MGIILSGFGLQLKVTLEARCLGVKTDDVTMIGKDRGEFFTSMKIVTKQENFKWEVVNVYGPVQLERKAAFLAELGKKLQTWRILL
jgi:hypothetical protein